MRGEGPWRWWDEGGEVEVEFVVGIAVGEWGLVEWLREYSFVGDGEDRKVNLREKAKELKADIPVIYLVLCVIVKIFR